MKWGSRYPVSGVHECPFGQWQAEQITLLAMQNGVNAVVVYDSGNGWATFNE